MAPGRGKDRPEGDADTGLGRVGSRPRGLRDTRYRWAYFFGAVCPERATGAALVVPCVNREAMNLHLEEISRLR